MIISFPLSGLPSVLTLIGGLIAAGSGLWLIVSVSGTKRTHDKATIGVALGLSMAPTRLSAWGRTAGTSAHR